MGSLSAGSRLGPYSIVDRLGAGGMGQVWRAVDTRLDRQVAIKIVPPDLVNNSQLRVRFQREAKLISQLNHPHICTVHDIGDEDGIQYLVMELLDGETLAERLAKGALPLDQALRCGIEIASALDRAHREGIVHRDLKPGNIVLTKSGAKLLDFGLAKSGVAAAPTAVNDETQQKPLTEEGTIVGTFQYMAPEQVSGERVDARSDIFAFGAVLYEMLTGTPAFQGKNRTSLVAAILSSEPQPLAVVQPMTPPALDRVVRTCLAKEPDDRWQTAHDIKLQLEWIEEAGSQAGVAPPVMQRRRVRERSAWSLAAVALIVAFAAGGAYLRLLRKPTPVLQMAIEPPPNTTLATTLENSGSITISPDGRLLTLGARGEDGKTMLWLRPLDSANARPLAGTEGASFPFWSPDSRSLAFFSGGKLRKIDLNGTPPVVVCDAPNNPRSGSWNQRNVIIFSPLSLGPVCEVPATGGRAVAVTTLDASVGESTHRWASFLPDGEHFLYMAGTHSAGTKSDTNAIYVGSLHDAKRRTLVLRVRSNAVYASAHIIYVRDRVLVAQPFDADKLRVTGDQVAVAPNVDYDTNVFRGLFAAANDGTLVFHTATGSELSQLQAFDRAGKILRTIGDAAQYRACAISHDGSRLALGIEDLNSGVNSIWIEDIARNVRTRFTFGELGQGSPVWSPDGTRIAYGAISKRGVQDLFIKGTTGSANDELLVTDLTVKTPTSWSSDGRYLAYTSVDYTTRSRGDIYAVPLFGDRKPFPVVRTAFSETSAAFSPDGHWIAYDSDESGQPEVYVIAFPAAEGKWQVSVNGGTNAHWRSDGRELVYGSLDQKLMAVPVAISGSSITIGTPQMLFKSDGQGVAVDLNSDHSGGIAAIRVGGSSVESINVLTNWPAVLRTAAN